MTLPESWKSTRLMLNLPDGRNARIAFASGARHGLTVLTNHLSGDDAAVNEALKLNDEIREFVTESLA